MDIRLNDEHVLVQQTAARLAADHALLVAPADAGAQSDDGAWMALRDTGFLAMHVPERLGGAGASALDVALVAEQLALATVPRPVRRASDSRARTAGAVRSGRTRRGRRRGFPSASRSRWTRSSTESRGSVKPCVAWDSAHATHALLFDDAGSAVLVRDRG